MAAGGTVTLFVSTGNVQVPDVTGKTKAEATQILNDAKLQANTSPVESDQTPDTVVAQDVAPGTLVKQGRAINLLIAVAPTTATIPNDLVGKTTTGRRGAAGLGLNNFNRVDEQSDSRAANVIRTDPTAGDEVPLDQQIDIHVSKGPAGDEPDAGADAVAGERRRGRPAGRPLRRAQSRTSGCSPTERATAWSSPQISSQFASSRWPPSVSTDSGWNCTPCSGSARCCSPMMIAVGGAVTSSSSGIVPSTTASEWYRVAVNGSGRPASTPSPLWWTWLVLPCMSSGAW